jgi:hypothetical protein
MIQNIILIVLIILLIFFVSNDENLNKIISKKYIKYLFLLLIIYFIYQNYNFYLLIATIFIFIMINTNLKENFESINGMDLYQKYNDFKKNIYSKFETINEQFKNSSGRSRSYKEDILDDEYDIKPYLNEIKHENIVKETKNVKENNLTTTSEPFKNEVVNIKDLFENIKNEIKKLT